MSILYTRRVKEHKDFYPFLKPVKCQHQSNVVNYTCLIPTATQKKKKAIQRNTHKSIIKKPVSTIWLEEYDELSFLNSNSGTWDYIISCQGKNQRRLPTYQTTVMQVFGLKGLFQNSVKRKVVEAHVYQSSQTYDWKGFFPLKPPQLCEQLRKQSDCHLIIWRPPS